MRRFLTLVIVLVLVLVLITAVLFFDAQNGWKDPSPWDDDLDDELISWRSKVGRSLRMSVISWRRAFATETSSGSVVAAARFVWSFSFAFRNKVTPPYSSVPSRESHLGVFVLSSSSWAMH